MTVFNFSAGPAVLPKEVLRARSSRNARLARQRHVGDGDEPSRQRVHLDRGQGGGRSAQADVDRRRLRSAVPAGRRDRRERDRADEPARRSQRRSTSSTPANGRRSRSRKRRSTRRSTSRHRAKTRTSPMCRRARAGSCRPTPRTFTCAPTRRSAVSNTTGRRTSARCRWWPTCRRTFCRVRSTCRSYGVIYGGAQKNAGPAGLTRGHRAQGPARSRARDHAVGVSTGKSRRRAIRC